MPEMDDLVGLPDVDNGEEDVDLDEARAEDEQEVQILEALMQKGPALPVEIAVRTLSFPEEIAAPLHNLEHKGDVERQRLQKGEMFVLTQRGKERLQRRQDRESSR